MLMHPMRGCNLLTFLNYSIRLSKKTVQAQFDGNFKLAREAITKVQSEHGMNKEHSRKFFHLAPRAFKPNTDQSARLAERKALIEKIAKEPGIRGAAGRAFKEVMFDAYYLAFSLTEEHIESILQAAQKHFETESQAYTIFKACPNLINPKFPSTIQEKIKIMQDYLQTDKSKIMQIFQASPYLISSSARKFRESIYLFNTDYRLSKEQTAQKMKTMGELFLFGHRYLKGILDVPTGWGLKNQQASDILFQHPLLFYNVPYNMLLFKRRILRYFNFTQNMGKLIFRQYPQIFIWSVRSLEQKCIFIKSRLQMPVTEANMQLLCFNYNKTLRPRGEILVKSKTVYDVNNIVEIMKLSDEKFVEKTGITLDRLAEEVAKFPVTEQLDFRKSQVLEKIKLKEKIRALADKYRR